MTTAEILARRRDPNAIAPYRWEAEYSDGTIVRQFDPIVGFQASTVIEAARTVALRILGHAQPLRLMRPYTDRAADEIRIQASTDVSLGVDGQTMALQVVRWFGFRYGVRWWLLRIDDAGCVCMTDRFD